MREITQAVSAKQMQISKLQSDIEALQLAAAVLQGKNAPAKVTASKPKGKRKRRKNRAAAKGSAAKPKTTQKRRKKRAAAKGSAAKPKTTQKRKVTWSASDREAISKRMKAYWAKRRKAKQSSQ